MDLFGFLKLIGGLSLFLFGMNVMGQALEKRAGGSLRSLLGKMTGSKLAGFLTGLCVTAVIQSSSATTVMVVGFANSGLMTLSQAINVIMGANVGTTATAWILSLGGIDGSSLFVRLLKPSSFTPVLALIGIVFTMFSKSSKRRDTGTVLLGFATLMFGMETMTAAVSSLADVPAFRQAFLLFTNPVLGVLAGAVLTGIIQSSSASVGILQSLAATGQVTYAAAIPIIMGQNIGTCVTALLSSVGTNRNARRAALVHLMFNIIGTAVWLCVFCIVRAAAAPAILGQSASLAGIAAAHSLFNIACTALLLPASGLLERLAVRLVPEPASAQPEKTVELDERLFAAPPLAIERSEQSAFRMALCAKSALSGAVESLRSFDAEKNAAVRADEDQTDRLEDEIGTYLVHLSAHGISAELSAESAELLKVIGDYERIADHCVNLVESAEEMHEKGISFSDEARRGLDVMINAVQEVLTLASAAFENGDASTAEGVEPLEQVVDDLRDKLRSGHIARLQQGVCTIDAGFIWSDILTNLERISDHCSNIALSVIDRGENTMSAHAAAESVRTGSPDFDLRRREFAKKYAI